MSATSWVDVHSSDLKDRTYEQLALGPTVSDYLARRAIGGLAARTLDTYERDLARLCTLTDPKPAGDITTRDLELIVGTWPLRSRPRARAAFRAFFDHLYADGVIDADPARRLPVIRTDRQKIIEVFTEREQDNLKRLPPELRDRALTTLLLNTGIRKSEARALKVGDIDLDQGIVKVRRGKGGKGRVVPLRDGEETVRILAELMVLEGLGRDDWLWPTRYVNPSGETVRRDRELGPGGFQRWWVRMCAEAGILYRNAHVCRHTYATQRLGQGVSMRTVSRLLGHSSIRTTIDLYDHQSVDDIALELEQAFERSGA